MNIIKIILVVLALNFSSSVFAAITYTQFDNGDTYEGNWVNDVINGYGKYTWSSGDVYEGNQVNGLINGYGKYTLSSGEVYYEGNWVNGAMSD